MAQPNQRRTERLLLSVPIRVEGVNASGQKFFENTRTVIINRHGASIQLKHPTNPGATLKIQNLMAQREAEFRVVGPTQPKSEMGGEWGVECRDEKGNIWGIDFPPIEDQEPPCSALLECRRCHAVALTPLSLVENDVLSASGLLTKECKTCGRTTPWGYNEKQVAIPAPGQEPEPSIKEIIEPPRPDASRRTHSRVALRLPIRVRSYYGTEEIGKTENVSKGGLCFVSEKDYEIGEGLRVTCPYDPKGHNIEVRGQVVRREGMDGTARKIYGVRYEKESQRA
jgi:hypothetical protein